MPRNPRPIDEARAITKEKRRAWIEKNKAKYKAKIHEWYVKNRKSSLERSRAWYVNNREAVRRKYRELYSSDVDLQRERKRLWVEKRPMVYAKIYARSLAKRRVLMSTKTHPLHDIDIEEKMIAQCRDIEASTGIAHCIDHIIPISKGGFHHHDNLQILPSVINRKKYNNPTWEQEGFRCWRNVPRFLWPDGLLETYDNLLKTA